ncbi:hypothetical protein [Chitinophaga japonensis]|uniref:Uncharacterized protein n=1 Tax=Chitinophaga japonensis TaxID=104662 RepID=A0A562SY75_CHIJA|nr:hypothetical protein [Chitinophaga japonensis]TWI86299.1 hypothetical protein LX66_3553 [Chitinophaga japonensis]
MVIKVKPKYTAEQIRQVLADRVAKLDKAIISNFRYIGEKFVKNARENGNYTDRTGNLRSSIGYVILKNGAQVKENFRSVSGGKDGLNQAKQSAKDAAKAFPKGYVLIVVAGMDYAAAVESRGYDVISSSSTQAKEDLRVAIEGLKKRIDNVR